MTDEAGSKQQGQVDVTFTAASPPATIFMGLGVGIPSTATDGRATCAVASGDSVNVQAGPIPQLSSTAAAGALCFAAFDVGNPIAPASYVATVTRP